MKPASTTIVSTYGTIWMNCTGMSSPDGSLTTPCIWMVIASVSPKNEQAISVCTGRHLPKMRAASAMKPQPDVMFRVNRDDCPIDRYAPPMAASAPDSSTPL